MNVRIPIVDYRHVLVLFRDGEFIGQAVPIDVDGSWVVQKGYTHTGIVDGGIYEYYRIIAAQKRVDQDDSFYIKRCVDRIVHVYNSGVAVEFPETDFINSRTGKCVVLEINIQGFFIAEVLKIIEITGRKVVYHTIAKIDLSSSEDHRRTGIGISGNGKPVTEILAGNDLSGNLACTNVRRTGMRSCQTNKE